MEKLIKFDNFIKNVDLAKYREKYSHIKIVEMDLPKNIQALKSMYKYYWSEINLNNILDYEDYYNLYYNEIKEDIELFREKTEMCSNCFNKGLRARIYRTWASIITQIHAGYVAESVFGINSIDMNEELDHKGKDFVINYNNDTIGIQVKKESKRPEARRIPSQNNDEKMIEIKYCVPTSDYFDNPLYVNGEHKGKIKDKLLDFCKFNKDGGILNRYDNGFVVFTDKIFKDIKNDLDNKKLFSN